MSNDQELFDLCKEVYERTGLTDTGWWLNHVHNLDGQWEWVQSHYEGGYEHYPLYTSDYLLDKLPNDVILKKTEDGDYRAYAPKTVPINSILSDIPLKALLKLVTALDDAGVKL